MRVTSPAELQDRLYALYRVPGVRNTRTHVVLRSHIKRPPSGEDSRGQQVRTDSGVLID